MPAGPQTPRSTDDPFGLKRFEAAQAAVIEQVMRELRHGRKTTHWMWFVFPQIQGLGSSPAARFYAIHSRGEAEAYLAHPVLGERLRECTATVLAHRGLTASQIFGYPDDLKLRSSMTLFASVSPSGSVFHRVLEAFFENQPDAATLRILACGRRDESGVNLAV